MKPFPSASAAFLSALMIGIGMVRAAPAAQTPTEAPVPVSPVDSTHPIPLDTAGGVTLAWNPSADAGSYEVQLGPMPYGLVIPIFDVVVNGTSQPTASLSKGIAYIWRVRAKNTAGDGPWSAEQYFRTDPLPGPNPIAPADRMTGVASKPSIHFTWSEPNPNPASHAIPAAASPPPAQGYAYQLQVCTDSTFPATPLPMPSMPPPLPYIVNLTLTASPGAVLLDTALAGFTFSKTYYWRVKTTLGSSTSDWSTIHSFTTAPPPPASITLLAPAPGAGDVAELPVLKWTDSNRPHLPGMPMILMPFWLRVATDSTFPDAAPSPAGMGPPPSAPYLVNETIQDTTRTPTQALTRGQKYYWRVMVQESSYGDGSFASGSFTVLPDAPDMPFLVSPMDAASAIPLAGPLTWNAAARATRYRVQIGSDAGFADAAAYIESTTANLSLSVSLSPSAHYYWRARAENGGGASAYTAARAFTTVPLLPAAPNLIAPRDDSSGAPAVVTLSWSTLAGAAYHVQLAADSGFNVLTAADSGLAVSAWSTPTLATGAAYYWRVRAKNAAGAGPWSGVSRFSTLPAPLPGVTLVFPGPGDTLTGDSLIARWHSAGPTASRYRVQVSADSTFTSPVSDSLIQDTLKTVRYANGNGRYWWRVQAYNAAGWGPYGDVRWFVVSNPTTGLAGGARTDGGIVVEPGSGGQGLLRYALADASRVRISLFDMRGRERVRLVDAGQGAGAYVVELGGEGLGQGWYMVRFEAVAVGNGTGAGAGAAVGRGATRRDVPVFLGR